MKVPDRTARIELAGSLTIERADEVKSLLINALFNSDHLVLDVREVVEADLTGLQLICAAHRSAVSNGKEITMDCASSSALSAVLARAGYVRLGGCAAGKKCLFTEASRG